MISFQQALADGTIDPSKTYKAVHFTDTDLVSVAAQIDAVEPGWGTETLNGFTEQLVRLVCLRMMSLNYLQVMVDRSGLS